MRHTQAGLEDIASVEHTLKGMAKQPGLPFIQLASMMRFEFPDQDEALVKVGLSGLHTFSLCFRTCDCGKFCFYTMHIT
jgi:hypothetical protein